jgi:hypothetical protein
MRLRTILLTLAFVIPVHAAKKTGVVCVAAFHVQAIENGPNMSQTTWAPARDSKFEFRIGKIKAIVPHGQMVAIANVPADRTVMVGVRLDGKPFESFPLDLRKEEKRRACLWLYHGYWHWVNTGWDEAKGCRCGG